MYNANIDQFKKEIENKNKLEILEYTTVKLNQAEDILVNAKACKDTDMLEEYITFLKWFIAQL